MRIFFRLLFWLIIIAAFFFFLKMIWPFAQQEKADETILHTTILERIESLGKLELVKYNFQEITELTQKNSRYLGIFPSGDSKAVLISHGEAVGCIDLTQISPQDMHLRNDSLFIDIPDPELCYYKLDLERTRIYSVEKGVYYKNEGELIERAYQTAEKQIKRAALSSGILNQTTENAEIMLKAFLEEVSGKKVVFVKRVANEDIKSF